MSATGAARPAERDVVHAVFGDEARHATSPRRSSLIAVLADADLIVHAGDVVSAAALRELEELGPVAAVHGNVDDAELQAALPGRRVVETGGARIGVVHDAGPRAGRHERLAAAFPDCDAIVYGHTHLPEVTRAADVWILNPGSPTERRRAPHRSLIVVEVDGLDLRPRLVTLP